MSTTFEHEVELLEGLTLRFTSTAVHPDAGVAWPWHHAMLVLGTVGDRNPIAAELGDGLFVDEVLRARHGEIFTKVEQTEPTEEKWITTVVFSDAKWIAPELRVGHRWSSGA